MTAKYANIRSASPPRASDSHKHWHHLRGPSQVLSVVYLIFTEGSSASSGDDLTEPYAVARSHQ